jgi:hypothetical protein
MWQALRDEALLRANEARRRAREVAAAAREILEDARAAIEAGEDDEDLFSTDLAESSDPIQTMSPVATTPPLPLDLDRDSQSRRPQIQTSSALPGDKTDPIPLESASRPLQPVKTSPALLPKSWELSPPQTPTAGAERRSTQRRKPKHRGLGATPLGVMASSTGPGDVSHRKVPSTGISEEEIPSEKGDWTASPTSGATNGRKSSPGLLEQSNEQRNESGRESEAALACSAEGYITGMLATKAETWLSNRAAGVDTPGIHDDTESLTSVHSLTKQAEQVHSGPPCVRLESKVSTDKGAYGHQDINDASLRIAQTKDECEAHTHPEPYSQSPAETCFTSARSDLPMRTSQSALLRSSELAAISRDSQDSGRVQKSAHSSQLAHIDAADRHQNTQTTPITTVMSVSPNTGKYQTPVSDSQGADMVGKLSGESGCAAQHPAAVLELGPLKSLVRASQSPHSSCDHESLIPTPLPTKDTKAYTPPDTAATWIQQADEDREREKQLQAVGVTSSVPGSAPLTTASGATALSTEITSLSDAKTESMPTPASKLAHVSSAAGAEQITESTTLSITTGESAEEQLSGTFRPQVESKDKQDMEPGIRPEQTSRQPSSKTSHRSADRPDEYNSMEQWRSEGSPEPAKADGWTRCEQNSSEESSSRQTLSSSSGSSRAPPVLSTLPAPVSIPDLDILHQKSSTNKPENPAASAELRSTHGGSSSRESYSGDFTHPEKMTFESEVGFRQVTVSPPPPPPIVSSTAPFGEETNPSGEFDDARDPRLHPTSDRSQCTSTALLSGFEVPRDTAHLPSNPADAPTDMTSPGTRILRDQLAKLAERLAASQESIHQWAVRYEALEADYALACAELDKLREHCVEQESNIESLQDALDDALAQLEQAKNDQQRSRTTEAEAQSALVDLQRSMEIMERRLLEHDERERKLSQALTAMQQSHEATLERREQQHRALLRTLEGRLRKIESEALEKQQEADKLQAMLDQQASEMLSARGEQARLIDQLAECKAALEEAQTRATRLWQERNCWKMLLLRHYYRAKLGMPSPADEQEPTAGPSDASPTNSTTKSANQSGADPEQAAALELVDIDQVVESTSADEPIDRPFLRQLVLVFLQSDRASQRQEALDLLLRLLQCTEAERKRVAQHLPARSNRVSLGREFVRFLWRETEPEPGTGPALARLNSTEPDAAPDAASSEVAKAGSTLR